MQEGKGTGGGGGAGPGSRLVKRLHQFAADASAEALPDTLGDFRAVPLQLDHVSDKLSYECPKHRTMLVYAYGGFKGDMFQAIVVAIA